MKIKFSKKYVAVALAVQVALAAARTSLVFADDKCPKTSILKISGKCDNGEAIFDILGIGLTVVTYGVGAAAIIGVLITGYQYITARDNSAQVAKAKNRLLQIVIGLVVWVMIWGILQFLLPGGLFADGS